MLSVKLILHVRVRIQAFTYNRKCDVQDTCIYIYIQHTRKETKAHPKTTHQSCTKDMCMKYNTWSCHLHVLPHTVKTVMCYLNATHVKVTQTYVHTPDVRLTQLILFYVMATCRFCVTCTQPFYSAPYIPYMHSRNFQDFSGFWA